MPQWYAIAIVCGISLVPGLSAQRNDLPHAFPREGATRVLQNEWISAWEVVWPADSPTVRFRTLDDPLHVVLVEFKR